MSVVGLNFRRTQRWRRCGPHEPVTSWRRNFPAPKYQHGTAVGNKYEKTPMPVASRRPRCVRPSGVEYVDLALPPLLSSPRSGALSLYRSPTTRPPPFHPFHLERSMRGAVAALDARMSGGGAERRRGRGADGANRGNLPPLFDCGNRSCRRRRWRSQCRGRTGGRGRNGVVSHNKGKK